MFEFKYHGIYFWAQVESLKNMKYPETQRFHEESFSSSSEAFIATLEMVENSKIPLELSCNSIWIYLNFKIIEWNLKK